MDAFEQISPSISKKFFKWMDLGKLDNGEFRKMGVKKETR